MKSGIVLSTALFSTISLVIIIVATTLFGRQRNTYTLSDDYEKNNLFSVVKNPYKDYNLDISTFNYEGHCSLIFKYPRHTLRDAVIFTVSYESNEKWKNQRKEVIKSLSISRNGVPNSSFILLLINDPPSLDFLNVMESFNITVVKVNQLPTGNSVVTRFIAFNRYLKENRDKFDRVIFSDFRDVVIFND
ncbi:Uncharacterized protein QTN25_000047 [Entamoeba marina]